MADGGTFYCIAVRTGNEMDCLNCDHPRGYQCPVRDLTCEHLEYLRLEKRESCGPEENARRERQREAQRKYHETHREQEKERCRAYYKANKGRRREYYFQYYEQHKAQKKEYDRQRYLKRKVKRMEEAIETIGNAVKCIEFRSENFCEPFTYQDGVCAGCPYDTTEEQRKEAAETILKVLSEC